MSSLLLFKCPMSHGTMKYTLKAHVCYFVLMIGLLPGADPGFVVRGGVSRRGVWGPLKVPQLIQGRTLVGGPGGLSPPETLGILGITDIYLNDNFEPTTPFFSDQKNLIWSLNFVG